MARNQVYLILVFKTYLIVSMKVVVDVVDSQNYVSNAYDLRGLGFVISSSIILSILTLFLYSSKIKANEYFGRKGSDLSMGSHEVRI